MELRAIKRILLQNLSDSKGNQSFITKLNNEKAISDFDYYSLMVFLHDLRR